MNTKIVVPVLIVVLVIGLGYLATNSPENEAVTVNESGSEAEAMESADVVVAETDDVMEAGDAMMKKEDGDAMMKKDDGDAMEAMGEGDAMVKEDVMVKEDTGPGTYDTYSADKVAANDGAVIFFHASWCPTCRALDRDITANATNIPAGLTILRANYDTDIALRQQYGVNRQHAMVQVDAAGNLIQKWDGGLTLDSIIEDVS